MAQSHPENTGNILITRGALYQNMAMMDNGTVYVSIHTKDFPMAKYVEIHLLGLIEYFQRFTRQQVEVTSIQIYPFFKEYSLNFDYLMKL